MLFEFLMNSLSVGAIDPFYSLYEIGNKNASLNELVRHCM